MKSENCLFTHFAFRRSFAIPFLMVVLFAFVFISCGKEEEKIVKEVVRPVKIITVQAGPATSSASGDVTAKYTSFPGQVRASKRVELAFKVVSGRLIKLPIAGKEGQEMKKGALLARIDPKDFLVNVNMAEGRLANANAALRRAESEYKREQNILKEDAGATSQAAVERKREARDKAKANIRSVKAEVQDANNKLSYTYLKAPFTGVVAKRYVDNFQEVQAKEPIVSLQDVSVLEILINIPEALMASVRSRPQDEVLAYARFETAPGQQFPLKMKEHAAAADPKTLTYQVVLAMPQPEGVNILPGMTATVVGTEPEKKAQTEEKDSGKKEIAVSEQVVIPAQAVMGAADGNAIAWRVKPDAMTVHKIELQVGDMTGSENIIVLKGLKPGDQIVISGLTKLQEGMKVKRWDPKK